MSFSANKIGILILTLTSSLSQFLVYRYIFQHLGREQMGIWSVVIASTTLGLISNFGLSNGLIKYVAEFKEKEDSVSILLFAGTANAINILFSLPIIALLYFPSKYYGISVLSGSQLTTFLEILPWCMFSVFLNNILSTYICLLDGFQSFFSRSITQSIGFVVFGISAIVLASYNGLIGISWALCIQAGFVFTISLIIIYKKKYLTYLFPVKLNSTACKKLIGYGVKFQTITILVFLFDPIVKFCLTKFFGLNATGIYELSNKVVIQFRNIVVNVNQVITPAVASIHEKQKINLYLEDVFASNYWNAINISILALSVMPMASYFFTGTIDPTYFSAYIFLSIGWLCNMLSTPFYYSFLGLGKMRFPIIQHFLYSLVTISFFALSQNHISLNLSFVIPSLALFIGGIYLIRAGFLYHKISISALRLFKQNYFYVYLILVTALLINQAFFYGKYYIIIILCSFCMWLYWLLKSEKIKNLIVQLSGTIPQNMLER